MDCKFDEMLLYEYLDDLLENEEKLMVSNHLSSCPECRRKIAEIKLLFYEIENLDEVTIPDDIADIRAYVVNQAFVEDESFVKKTYHTINSNYMKTKDVLQNTPVISSMLPSKDTAANVAKSILRTGKKAYKLASKDKKKTEKKKFKGLGDLL